MYKREVMLESDTGLHTKFVSILVKEASKYISEINLRKEEQNYNAKSIMGLLSMGAAKGDVLTIEAKGEDEKEAVNTLTVLIKNMRE